MRGRNRPGTARKERVDEKKKDTRFGRCEPQSKKW